MIFLSAGFGEIASGFVEELLCGAAGIGRISSLFEFVFCSGRVGDLKLGGVSAGGVSARCSVERPGVLAVGVSPGISITGPSGGAVSVAGWRRGVKPGDRRKIPPRD